MISLWLAFYLAHLLGMSSEAWWTFPFAITFLLLGMVEVIWYLKQSLR